MDLRQTPEYQTYMRQIGWKTVWDVHSQAMIFIRTIPLTGFSVLKIQRPTRIPSAATLRQLIRKYHVVQTNIEPLTDTAIDQLWRLGYRRNIIPFLPSNTILVNLKPDEKHLLKFMKPKTRYNLKVAGKRGVRVKIFDGDALLADKALFESLFEMQRMNARRLGIFMLPKQWFAAQVQAFGKQCFAAMAYVKQDLIAATFYMTSDTTVYYSHNGSTATGRHLLAPTACVWAGMQEGKRRGKAWLDFEGVYDPRSRVSRWKGFTRFKGGFGGRAFLYPGLYSRWHWPF